MMRGTFFRSSDQRLLILLMDINNASTDDGAARQNIQ